MNRSLRYLWAMPASVLGLALASLAAYRGRIVLINGIIEASGPLLDLALRRLIPIHGGAEAMTFGHVILGRTARTLAATRAHERVHVEQYERWGPLFILVYLGSSLWALAHGRHPYYDNRFEREAFARTIYPARTTRVFESNSNAR